MQTTYWASDKLWEIVQMRAGKLVSVLIHKTCWTIYCISKSYTYLVQLPWQRGRGGATFKVTLVVNSIMEVSCFGKSARRQT